jgi:hypothetical protein
MQHQKRIFISGATSYLASALVPKLLLQGHQVHALVRPGSEKKVPLHPSLHPARPELAIAPSPPWSHFDPLQVKSKWCPGQTPSPLTSSLTRGLELFRPLAEGRQGVPRTDFLVPGYADSGMR